MSLYSRVKDLPLEIEEVEFQLHRSETSSDFTRVSTEITLRGGDLEGRGEDVTYDEDLHPRFVEAVQAGELDLGLEGRYRFDGFSRELGEMDLFPGGLDREVFRNYRRWGFESAGLDLALRQEGVSLGEALDREPEPVHFVVSTRLGEPPTTERLERLLEVNAELEFKLDPTPDWSRELVREIDELCSVRVLDLKGQYEGTEVDNELGRELVQMLLEEFPDAVVEDPRLDGADVFEGHRDRVSWDAPIHGVRDVRDLPFFPGYLNVKPSRFGSVRSLFETIEYCESQGIGMYGGGQFELGVGRRQIQRLAGLFYSDASNDVAPPEYNQEDFGDDLPRSPLSLEADVGFG